MSNAEKEPGPPAPSAENVVLEKKPRVYKDIEHENHQATSKRSRPFILFS